MIAALLLAALPQERPNVVVVLADDMGYSDLGCYGGEIETPHLDALAANGLRFTQFANTGRCCPTRASLLTGLYPHQAGVGGMVHDEGKPGYRGRLNDSCATIAEVLGAAGYATMAAGKWHVTPFSYKTRLGSDRATWPRQRGFEHYYGALGGGGSYFDPPGLMRDNSYVRVVDEDYYYTDAIGEEAARFVREQAGMHGRPFFLYVAYTAPHWPLHAREGDVARYAERYRGGWDELRRERYARMLDLGLVEERWALTPRDERVPAWDDEPNKEWFARSMAVYAAQITAMDRSIGLVVTALEEIGALDDTLFLFLADNGGCDELLNGARYKRSDDIVDAAAPDGSPMRGGNRFDVLPGGPDTFASYGVGWANASNTPFRRYKKNSHQGGVATPLVVHWPAGIPADERGGLRHQPGHVIDVMATCVDVSGADYPEGVQPVEGVSLVPAFANEPVERGPIFWEHIGHRGVRDGDWKLVKTRGGEWELYDLAADRTELRDLAASEPARVERMEASWEAWAQRANVLK